MAVLAVTIIAISLWDRDWRWLRTIHPLPGLALALQSFCRGASRSRSKATARSTNNRSAMTSRPSSRRQETHGAPPGYYLALVS